MTTVKRFNHKEETIYECSEMVEAQMGEYVLADDYDAALLKLETYRVALTKIAAINDAAANDSLRRSGSYAAFDEPHSVRIAREALND